MIRSMAIEDNGSRPEAGRKPAASRKESGRIDAATRSVCLRNATLQGKHPQIFGASITFVCKRLRERFIGDCGFETNSPYGSLVPKPP
jgi:hypothetical protein